MAAINCHALSPLFNLSGLASSSAPLYLIMLITSSWITSTSVFQCDLVNWLKTRVRVFKAKALWYWVICSRFIQSIILSFYLLGWDIMRPAMLADVRTWKLECIYWFILSCMLPCIKWCTWQIGRKNLDNYHTVCKANLTSVLCILWRELCPSRPFVFASYFP